VTQCTTMRLFHTMQRAARLNQSGFLFDLLVLCAAVAIMLGGLVVRFRLPIVPLADGDTWGYLRPALSWLSGPGFPDALGRDWLYPALLAGILHISGDFRAITYTQHFLGFAAMLLFWLNWRSFWQLLPTQKPVRRRACFVFALLFFALYALNPQQALLENTIRPEGMLPFFEMAYFYCIISFFSARWRSHQTGVAIAFGAAGLGLSYMILLLKPSWGFSFGFSLLCLLVGGFGTTTRLLRFGPFLAGAVVTGFLLTLPKLLGFQYDAPYRRFLPCTLVSVHAPQILKTSPASPSLQANGSGGGQTAFYEELAKAFRSAKENPNHYDLLGFDPDYILFSSNFFSITKAKEGWSDRELIGNCYSAYFRAWIRTPWFMLQKIEKQLRLFLFPHGGDFYSTAQSVDLNREIAVSRLFLFDRPLAPPIQNIYQAYRERLNRPSSPHPLGFPILPKLAFFLARISFWLQVAFFAALVAVCLSRRGRAWRLAGLLVAAVLAATYGNVLTIAVVHSLDVVRYRVSYAPGFLLGLAMMMNYLLVLALGGLKLGKPDGGPKAAEANFEQTSGS